MPAGRATSDAVTPGSNGAATRRSFSSQDRRRRLSTDVITSTRGIVIGLLLGLPQTSDVPHQRTRRLSPEGYRLSPAQAIRVGTRRTWVPTSIRRRRECWRAQMGNPRDVKTHRDQVRNSTPSFRPWLGRAFPIRRSRALIHRGTPVDTREANRRARAEHRAR